MDAGILIGYFAKKSDARSALRALRRRGFRRAALVHKTAEGEIQLSEHWLARLLHSKSGVEPALLKDHGRWLVPDETSLILQAPVDVLQLPVALLRESGDTHPAVFLMHPERVSREEATPEAAVPLSPDQICRLAQDLAQNHLVDRQPRRSVTLLKNLENARRRVREVCACLSAAGRLEQIATPAAEWILDNEYATEGHARDVLLNLSKRYYEQLPVLASDPDRGLPRVYSLARELVSHTEMRLDRDNIRAFIAAYQSVQALTIGELWAIPQMLRIALIERIDALALTALADQRERQLADFWANRLLTATRRNPNQSFAMLAELAAAESAPSPYFASQLIDYLYDEDDVLVSVRVWLERALGRPLSEINLREQVLQTKNQITSANAFTSLRHLALMDWREIFEELCGMEQRLRLDPSGIYSGMDFESRDRCRRTVEEFSRRSDSTEEQVAQLAIDMAAASPEQPVASYLIGDGRQEMARRLRCRLSLRRRALEWVYRRYAPVYFLSLGGFLAIFVLLDFVINGFTLGGHPLTQQIGFTLLLLGPLSQLAIESVNYLVARLLPPRVLPKMDFRKSGIPDEFRTLVVVPMMLTDAETIRTEVEKLECRYLANKEDNLFFGLFSDYTDASSPKREDDAPLLQTAIEGMEGLNHRYGGGRFFLFHRERAWSESERKFIGWERKRGKLEELNRAIAGTRSVSAPRLVYVGDPNQLPNVRFVITLDQDTQLPHDTARRLIETLAHPLNQPRFTADGKIAPGSYTMIQPRVTASLPSASGSLFSRLFAFAEGINPYPQAVSDVYQDLSGEGSYQGKGIYDVRAFSRVLSGRFPENLILSHDLIEGAHVRVGLATDIELYDDFPQDYQSYSYRTHRWIRGDWQIAGWLFPRVPLPGGGRGPNPLGGFDRWKIFDNLRRSLLPLFSVGLLIASWLHSPRFAWMAALVIMVQLLFRPLAEPITKATTRKGLKSFSWAKVGHDLLRAMTDALLLPHQATVALSAVVEAGYRRLISHRRLLNWAPQTGPWRASHRRIVFVAGLGLASLFGGIMGMILYRFMPSALTMAAPWLVLWFFSPFLGLLLTREPRAANRPAPLPAGDVQFLKDIAQRTWRYFSDFVGNDTSWLPPDNYQVSHQNSLAMRTSPTNIGLWMVSVLGAYDAGYLTASQVIERLSRTMETIGRLERYEGHLLNWYDIKTLAPLEPRYVSTVDSGNLLGSLWTVEQGLGELLQGPLPRSQELSGDMRAMGERLVAGVRELSQAINMRFLYDPERKLFSIGYNVSRNRLDNSYYDLLASEARLGSFIAIARGDVPIEHWYSLNRPYGTAGRHRVLMSWTGTMFEYLMPLIFQRSFENSLLDKSTKEAVAVQRSYGRKRRVPWGISECAFGDLDFHKTYQYKAFGVPALALKRGLEEELVVAPYATLIALNIAPAEAVKNLKQLASLGLLNQYGYEEAVDFSRQSGRGGKLGVRIEAYMAHHQGMAFLSLTNFLHGGSIQRRFHADPRVRAFEALLQERIPVLPPLHLISLRESGHATISVEVLDRAESTFKTPHTPEPKSHMLGNGNYSVMVTNAGGGFSQWGPCEITRWRSDRTCDSWGTFCYLHEADSNRLWSTTYHPVDRTAETYSVSFSPDRALFQHTDKELHAETEVVVSPEDDVEIRRMTFVNRSDRVRRLNLTSYVELSMAPHKTDQQHPAFNKMFIQTEAVPEARSLIAFRRPRGPDDPPIYVAHRLTLGNAVPLPEDHPFEFECDRVRFIGRGRTLANPMGVFQALGNTQGTVLDPILSLRERLTLEPGQRVQVSMILAAASSREQALTLMGKYGEYHAVERAMEFAWGSAQLELRMLHIQPDEARRFQQLAGHLLFPNPRLRAPAERLEENRKGQSGLWPYAISGDLPIALITIGEMQDLGLVRQMLQAHTYWRMHGLTADLVILNEEAGDYDQPLQERLKQLIQTHSQLVGIDRPGGVFLRSAAQIPEEDLRLFKAAASIFLVAARGALPQQLGKGVAPPDLTEPLARKPAPREPTVPLPFLELNYFNSLGGFTPDGRDYAIYLGPNTHTPAPWVNVMANPSFGTMVSETGSGFTWSGNSQRNRLTGWSNDPVLDPCSEAIYIRDEESGETWTPTASPIREETAYRARHGAGTTVFEHNSHGILQELTVFVPADEGGGETIKLQRLRLKNDSSRRRKISITYYVEWILGENRESSQMHVKTLWDHESQALFAENRYHPDAGDRVAFAALSIPAASYTGDRTSFIGRNRTLANPAAMERKGLSRRTGAGLDPCAALRSAFELQPGETRELTCLMGEAASRALARKLVLTYRNDAAVEASLDQTKAWWNEFSSAIEVHTPELSVDLLVNQWLLYQTLSCRLWGRSAFYQSGGAFGFRDQLQDVMALVYSRPDLARLQILKAARRQFKEGDVQHWWHEPTGAGVRSRISDDLLWLPFVVTHYVRTTGDAGILKAELPFLSAPLLADDQTETLSIPEVTVESATLFEHCRRAVSRGLTIGPHGLPLIGTGDWNDGLNRVGVGGRGESVWLGWFLADVLNGMMELSGLLGFSDLCQDYGKERAALIRRIEKAGWDESWYLRGTFDDGSPLGAAANTEAKIDSLPQTWAWLSGAADPARAAIGLESAWDHLIHEDEGLVLLFEPPFDKSTPSPGYIAGYPPGVRENGGQYTHAAIWMAMALARKGDGSRAAKILRMANPIERAHDAESVWRYGIEPYAVAADVYRLPGRTGQGGWSWYTGSAAWMYRAWVEEILGLKVRGETMQLNPTIPGWWDGFKMRYRHGEAIYVIQVENPEHCERGIAFVEIDGRRVKDGVIPLTKDLIKHRVLVRMGASG